MIKKMTYLMGGLALASCANVPTGPAPQSGNRSISRETRTVWICKAVCEYFVPNNFKNPRHTIQFGNYSQGRDLIVAASDSKDEAITNLEKKCSDASPSSPKYNIYKSYGVDMSKPSESLGDKDFGYTPSIKLNNSNTDEFCYQGEYTDFIHYANNKTVDPANARLPGVDTPR